MPKVGKGDKAADFPYTKEGMEAAEDYAQQTNQEIDYSPGGTKNAPDMRETYHMGGQVPGQLGFGQNPKLINPKMNPLGNTAKVNPNPLPQIWEKGGKVKE